MHATHQFFLTRRSLYIVVLDSRKDEKIEYWLKHVKTFGGDSPVLVVKELVTMPDNPEITVTYRHLVRLEEKGIKDYFPDGSENAYNVKDLLGAVKVPMKKGNEEEILKILQKISEISNKLDTKETLAQKANEIFMLKPNAFGVGIDIHKILEILFSKKK